MPLLTATPRIARPARGPVLAAALLLTMVAGADPGDPETVSESVSLDAFLAGLDDQCETSAAFDAFRQALRDEQGGSYRLTPEPAKAQVDPRLHAAMGEIRILESSQEYQIIQVPIAGTWRGVPVAHLDLLMGLGNGFSGVGVTFQLPHETALATFEQRIANSARRLKAQAHEGYEILTYLSTEEGRVRLWCDWSM